MKDLKIKYVKKYTNSLKKVKIRALDSLKVNFYGWFGAVSD